MSPPPESPPEQFDPTPILEVLERHRVQYVVVGGYAAVLHGAQRLTRDIDVVPATTHENLIRLAEALRELGARVRTDVVPEGLPFAASAESLAGLNMVNLVTAGGELDLTFRPSGTEGYEDLNRAATNRTVGTVEVRLAALADVIRSKEAAARNKDFLALPELYELAAGQDGVDPRTAAAFKARATAALNFPTSAAKARRQPSAPPSAQDRIAAARAALEAGRRQRHEGREV